MDKDQSGDAEIVREVTAAVRAADKAFERVGGSSRHWVRDCLLPELNRRGIVVTLLSSDKEEPA